MRHPVEVLFRASHTNNIIDCAVWLTRWPCRFATLQFASGSAVSLRGYAVEGGAVRPVGGGRAVIDEEPAVGVHGVFEMDHAGDGVFEPAHNIEGNYDIGRHGQRLGGQVAAVALGLGKITPDGGKHAARSIDHDERVWQGQGVLHFDGFE